MWNHFVMIFLAFWMGQIFRRILINFMTVSTSFDIPRTYMYQRVHYHVKLQEIFMLEVKYICLESRESAEPVESREYVAAIDSAASTRFHGLYRVYGFLIDSIDFTESVGSTDFIERGGSITSA